jgi:hypothetical protein
VALQLGAGTPGRAAGRLHQPVDLAPVAPVAGVAAGALQDAVKHSRERVQFGQAISSFQAVQHLLADMATQVEAARALLYATAKTIDAGEKKFAKESAMTKLFCSDVAMKVTVDAVQVMGGYGYMREYPMEKQARSGLPKGPGVYRMLAADDTILYVGKARNLRNRLRTYTSTGEAPDPKVAVLRARVRSFDTIVTRSETEALILEANLIKEHHPRYTVKLRDDKKYPLVKVTLGETYPRASVTRTVREDGSRYFGPYTDAKAIRRTLRAIRQLFPVRQCPTFKRRTRPCLNFQIGRCLGPCRGVVAPEEYGEMIAELCLFLDGRAGDVVTRLREHMARASDARQFEEAARTFPRVLDHHHAS